MHEPLLSAAEVLETLRLLPAERREVKFRLLRSLLERMGKLEAYFLAKLILHKPGFGLDYSSALLAQLIAQAYGPRLRCGICLSSRYFVCARVLAARKRGFRAG